MSEVGHKFYDRLRRHGDRALREADVWGNRPEESADDPESPRHLAPTETT
jgi:hydrogenase small subunit